MKAALELEIFTAIAEGNTTAGAIARRCQCAERGVRILCDFLTIHDFLRKDGALRFSAGVSPFSSTVILVRMSVP